MANVSSRDVVPWFGPAIQAARKKHGWTLRELAEGAGSSAGAVLAIEAGRRGVSLSLALRLCDALGVTVDSLRPAE